jgi:MFS family permease
MQTVGELWLVLSLTGSPLAVGVTTALQFTPMLLFGAWGGLVADRLDKRRLLTYTQIAMALPALALWGLAGSGVVQTWMIFALVFARGAVNAIDNPARQAFLVELVSPARLVNAVGLNSALVQVSRVAGPAMAAVVIASVGVADCFLINAASFAAMIVALRRMDRGEMHLNEPAPRQAGQLRSALRYVRATPALLIPLVLMAVIGTLSYNFQTLLPLLARFTFHGNAGTYAALTTAMGVGAVIGALAASSRRQVTPALLVGSALAFGGGLLLAAAAPTLDTEAVSLALTGAASVTFASSVNSSLQLRVRPSMRGRVMALYSVVFLGSNPIGGPLMGWISGAAGPRAGLVLGAGAAVAGGLVARVAFARMPDVATGEHRVAQHVEGRPRAASTGRSAVRPPGRSRQPAAARSRTAGAGAVVAARPKAEPEPPPARR